jgi:cytochrome P450
MRLRPSEISMTARQRRFGTIEPCSMHPDIDNAIVDPAVYADPPLYHARFAELRREDPVHWTEPDAYRPFWTVTRHAHIVEAQRQPAIFESGGRVMLATREAEDRIARHTGGSRRPYRGITALNGTEHTNLRNVTRDWFTARSLRNLESRIASIARASLAHMASLGDRCDFVEDVALWYPLRVILMIFGLPAEHEAKMLKLSKEINGAQDPELRRSESEGEHMLAVIGEMAKFFSELAAERRRSPQEDLASLIANATIVGSPLSDADVFGYYLAITVAGHDTTSASTAAGVLALIENPAELARLRAQPELVPLAVDEMVRWAAPVKHFFRRATRDYVLGGKTIKAGDDLMMCYPSACRDEEVFADPFTFRVDRKPNPHLAFGFGPHVCMGQYLAKLEMAVFFREFLERIEHFDLADTPEHSRTLFMGGLKHLPIRYRTRAA